MNGKWILVALLTATFASSTSAAESFDFNRDIRAILSDNCFQCHGPDPKQRQGGTDGLRLDTEKGALTDLGGYTALNRVSPEKSVLLKRINSRDPDERMPPGDSGKKLTAREIELLTEWVKQGAPYARHWSYVKPVRQKLPQVKQAKWPRNDIDHFILARLEAEGLAPSAAADRFAIIRRVSLDLTGIPPTLEEVDRFVNDQDQHAYEKLIDRLLAKKSFGEHWARMWLDLARYADSSGYADDPARTIWGFRDYVIRSINTNKPFDQFTIEQIAGDLLPNRTEEQLLATAFHRNTLTNSEGGTNDEEFRNVAIVDRVNTTMAVWMGTTIACAQCHSHKFDPISQAEFFSVFAIFNNTEDADRRNESPLAQVFSADQKRNKASWQSEIVELEKVVQTLTPPLAKSQAVWERQFSKALDWRVLKPTAWKSKSGRTLTILDDNSVLAKQAAKTDVLTIELAVGPGKMTALKLETLPDESLPAKGPGFAKGNFLVSHISASVVPSGTSSITGRFVRIEVPGKQKILSLAEVQIFSGADNIARRGTAKQSSTEYDGPARLAIDGNTNGDYAKAKSTTHTAISANPWWEVDLKTAQPIDRIVVWNRTDNNLKSRLDNSRVIILNDKHEPIWEKKIAKAPKLHSEFETGGARKVQLVAAYADFTQQGFSASDVLDAKNVNKGWAIGPQFGRAHSLTLLPSAAVDIPANSVLSVTIKQLSKFDNHTLRRLRLSVTSGTAALEFAMIPGPVLRILKTKPIDRLAADSKTLAEYYLSIAPELKPTRNRLASLKKQLAGMKPYTSVPIMRELAAGRRRKTLIQRRGNFLDTGKEVSVGVPSAFHPIPDGVPVDRLALARWLVDNENPLTPRVIANRYWESVFGIGIVATSEEFGSQGQRPSHPELLDWLATELIRNKWDIKKFLKLLVTSAAYRQSSAVTPSQYELDPENRLLARGPRFRLSAEMIRDQALAVSGLLSTKMYGPPVKPPQPTMGLKAAFGSATDWKTSAGEDRYRRGLYTTWRRSNPYPSMATFDAPNREVCTIRRSRTNTPLQALVTLNDPVYVEAAQSLARRMLAAGKTAAERARFGFRVCLARHPSDLELVRLLRLYETAKARFSKQPDMAKQLATDPLGPVPKGADVVELAALTLVSNVLLNLDEMLMKR